MGKVTPEALGRKIDALNLWDAVRPYNWAEKPLGTVLPYFCTLMGGDPKLVKVRLLMIEGWQTFHDFVRTRIDREFGYYQTPMEMPHFELAVAYDGEARVFRHDPGYIPRPLAAPEEALVLKLLWETYGVMMRIESDRKLPMRYASEKAMFARVETSPGKWIDAPLEIPEPQPFTERVSLPKDLLAKAKDLAIDEKETLELDFRLKMDMMTKEPRPRACYELKAVVVGTGEEVASEYTSVAPEGGLKGMWEAMPGRVLKRLVEHGRIPGEIQVCSARVFRLLRALGLELPFRLSLHDALPTLGVEKL